MATRFNHQWKVGTEGLERPDQRMGKKPSQPVQHYSPPPPTTNPPFAPRSDRRATIDSDEAAKVYNGFLMKTTPKVIDSDQAAKAYNGILIKKTRNGDAINDNQTARTHNEFVAKTGKGAIARDEAAAAEPASNGYVVVNCNPTTPTKKPVRAMFYPNDSRMGREAYM